MTSPLWSEYSVEVGYATFWLVSTYIFHAKGLQGSCQYSHIESRGRTHDLVHSDLCGLLLALVRFFGGHDVSGGASDAESVGQWRSAGLAEVLRDLGNLRTILLQQCASGSLCTRQGRG